jgi:hypothetical protein
MEGSSIPLVHSSDFSCLRIVSAMPSWSLVHPGGKMVQLAQASAVARQMHLDFAET